MNNTFKKIYIYNKYNLKFKFQYDIKNNITKKLKNY